MALRSHRNKNILMFADTDRDADMLYLTRFGAPDPFVYLRPASGRSYVVMSDLEIDRARKEASVNHVLSFTHYARIARDRFGKKAGVVETIVCLLREFKIRSVIVPPQFPLALADGLRRRRIAVKAAPAPFLPEREIKSPNEVDAIRKAMRSTERAIRAAFDVLEKSKISSGYVVYKGRRLTAEALKAVINTNLMGQGYLPSFTIVASGKHGCDPHDAGSGPIRANSPIIIDVFPRSEKTGYFADITRTVVRGKASPFVQRMYRAVHSAQTGALKQIRAGAVARDIHQAVIDNFTARGFETGEKDGRHQGFFHGTGHGIGLEIHEAPRIATNTTKLKKGMVVTVEPGLYYYPHGGVRIEDSVVVTRTGIDNLTRLPKFLEI